MNYPENLKYTKDHEWVLMDGDVAVVGISDFAQDALGDLVFINLPEVDDEVTAGEAFGDVESVKACKQPSNFGQEQALHLRKMDHQPIRRQP